MGILPYLTRLKKICFSAVELMHVYAPVLNACKRISPAIKTRFERVEACFIGTVNTLAYNLSIVLRLDKKKTSKNFKKSTDYQLHNEWMKDTLDSELNSRAVGAVYRRRKMLDHKRATQWLSFRQIAHTMHFSALFHIPIL